MYTRKAKPTITNPTVAPATFNNANKQTLYRFRVSADSAGGTVDLYELDFNVTTAAGMTLANWALYNITEATAANWSCTLSGSVVSCTASAGDEVAAGGYEDFKLYVDVTGAGSQDYISTYLVEDTGTPATNDAAADLVDASNIVWSDGSTVPHSVDSEDWTDGVLVKDANAYGSSQITYYPITS